MTTTAAFLALFLAGLAGTLHCLTMCGPLLVAFSTRARKPEEHRGPQILPWAGYHLGRIWTYSLLGFACGWLLLRAREISHGWPWQKGVGTAAAVLLVAFGIATWTRPGLRSRAASLPCQLTENGPLRSLSSDPTFTARLLLGALMGFLPCGLVYAALIVAAVLPTPLHSAAGMLCFGLGTLPSLTALRWTLNRLRLRGSRFTLPTWLRHAPILSMVWVASGLFVLARTWLTHAH